MLGVQPVRTARASVSHRPATPASHSPIGSLDESRLSSGSAWSTLSERAQQPSSLGSREARPRSDLRKGTPPRPVVQLGFNVDSSKKGCAVAAPALPAAPRSSLLQSCFRSSIPASALKDTINHNLSHPDCVRLSERWEAAKRSGTAHVLYHRTVQQAYVIAATVHGAAIASDGSRVMDRLEKTALTVADLGLDAVAVAAALLHQALDDGELDEAVLRTFIGSEVAALVAGAAQATRLSRLYTQQPSLQDEDNTEKLRTALIALGDARVMLIKLAARLQRARALDVLHGPAKARFLLATERVFIPIANRLGIWCIKAELEDLCFKAREPQRYAALKAAVDSKLQQSQAAINEFIHDSVTLLEDAGLPVEDVEGRPKSLCSIRDKLARKGQSVESIDNLFDILAVRIIVASKNACYASQRALAQRWPQRAARDRNYIRSPKPNGYQSIHTVYVTDCGLPIEVQLRTPQMHWNAEFGVASHWAYKERRGRLGAAEDALVATHEQLVAWSRMVLTYGHGLTDYRKARGAAHLRRSSTLSGVTLDMMDAAAGRPRRQRPPRARSACADLPGARRRTFEDYVAESMTTGPTALAGIYVAVSWPGGATLCALEGDCSSVGKLLAGGEGALSGVAPSRLLVNGAAATGACHRLRMGDCVHVRPALAPEAIWQASRHVLRGRQNPLVAAQQELFRVMTRNIRGEEDAVASTL